MARRLKRYLQEYMKDIKDRHRWFYEFIYENQMEPWQRNWRFEDITWREPPDISRTFVDCSLGWMKH